MVSTGAHKGPAIAGRAFAARSSRAQAAHLRVVGDALVLEGEAGLLTQGSLDQVTIDIPLGSAPRKLTFSDGTVFETDDHAAIDAITGPTRGGVLHHYEQFRPRLVVVVLVCLAAAWALWRYGLDILASIAIAFTPPILVDQMDAGTMLTIDTTMASPSQLPDDERARVEKIFGQLLEKVSDREKDGTEFELLFRAMPSVGPNAFALPGGTVVMTDEFVKTFPQDDVLAGVLGHEIGHVIEKHGLRQVYRSLSIYILIAFLAGDTGPILEDIILEGNLLLSLSYSRGHESDADEFGLRLADKAGFDPAGLKSFFDKVSKMGSEPPQWMSTHPNSAERMQAIDKFIDEQL